MNSIAYIRKHILTLVQDKFKLSDEEYKSMILNFNQDPKFGDLSLNAAFVISCATKLGSQDIAKEIVEILTSPLIDEHENKLVSHIKSVSVAGNGFVNIALTQETWNTAAHELVVHPAYCFKLFSDEPKYSYLVEFVSANPTGPLSLSHGRNAILGDVISRVLSFLGHKVCKEFYVNDAGKQIINLGFSLRKKVYSLLAIPFDFGDVEAQYDNEYMDVLAEKMVSDFGLEVKEKEAVFFEEYAKNYFLSKIQQDLKSYRVDFDSWVSEEDLHKTGKVEQALSWLEKKELTYQGDGAVWFKTTEFGDEKDRVLVKSDGSNTYLLPDVAYHKTKFARGFDFVVDILGQDHHGCEKRLHAGVQALGYDSSKLKIIFYQLVLIKQGDDFVRMSKRKGNFHSLRDVIDLVGVDVARYFYLNKKNDSHLSLDLELALKQTDENPVFYIQYAYVRSLAILNKAASHPLFAEYVKKLQNKTMNEIDAAQVEYEFLQDEISLLKKIFSLRQVLFAISQTFQAHLLANYTFELSQAFHGYYAGHKIIDPLDVKISNSRLLLTCVVSNTLAICFDLLGISKPDKM